MAESENVAANDDEVEQIDLDPRRPSFYSDAAAVAAYLISGNGRWQDSCQRMVTTALMHHAMLAERENRTCLLVEIQDALEEACRRIRRHKNIGTIIDRTTHSFTSKQVGISVDA